MPNCVKQNSLHSTNGENNHQKEYTTVDTRVACLHGIMCSSTSNTLTADISKNIIRVTKLMPLPSERCNETTLAQISNEQLLVQYRT